MIRATVTQSEGKTTIKIEGLGVLIRGLKLANPKLLKALKKSLKEACRPVLRKARANAQAIADDGTYAESIALSSRKAGLQYVLKSTDPAAGVKEFAKPGATRLVGQSARSSTQRARKRAGQSLAPGLRAVRVGVPRRANAPRVMVPAVNDSADEVIAAIDDAIEAVMQEVANG